MRVMQYLYTTISSSGHDTIAVVGNATARIGDPSDQTKDRKRLSDEIIDKNSTGIENCITKLFETHEREIYVNRGVKRLPKIKILRNYDWYRTFNVIDFMSREGRTFRMGAMLGNIALYMFSCIFDFGKFD